MKGGGGGGGRPGKREGGGVKKEGGRGWGKGGTGESPYQGGLPVVMGLQPQEQVSPN